MDRNTDNSTASLSMVDVIRNGAPVAKRPDITSYVYEKEVEDWRKAHKLVDATTGEDLILPVTRTIWNGEEVTIIEFKPSRFATNQGYIYTNKNEVLVPSVIRAKIVAVAV